MRKNILGTIAFLLASTLSSQAHANNIDSRDKVGTIGIGSYSSSIVSDGTLFGPYLGATLIATYNITPLISASSHLYSVDYFDETISGVDAFIRLGHQGIGFTYFAGLGMFSETVSTTASSFTLDASGLALGYGIGYNWESLALNWEGAVRTTGDYQNNLGGATVIQATGSLNLAFRF